MSVALNLLVRLQNSAIALFAKAPLEGLVKTRLMSVLTAAQAADFHRHCVLAAWERLAGLKQSDAFLYSDISWPEYTVLAGQLNYRVQCGTDLGEKMRNCLEELLASGYEKVVLVGSDAPTLPVEQLVEALDALTEYDAVLGPSEDGGFHLIAARKTSPLMFDSVRWSRADTCSRTLQALSDSGLRTSKTSNRWYDVDRPEDLDRLARDPDLPVELENWLKRHYRPDS